MKKVRQDGWSKEEDMLLANQVLLNIRQGKTQLEAFKDIAKKLSRTPAACGFRWNATLRGDYMGQVEKAKNERLNDIHVNDDKEEKTNDIAIDSMIHLLQQFQSSMQNQSNKNELEKLQEENQYLKEEINRYQAAWQEMNHLWEWIQQKEQKSESIN